MKDFNTWVNEEFAAVGVAPEGNVSGMGDPTPPTSTTPGSGDAWPSLGAPSTLSTQSQSKAFSVKDKKVGDVVEVENKKVTITEITGRTKDRRLLCIAFNGKLKDDTKVKVVYDDGKDNYVFKK